MTDRDQNLLNCRLIVYDKSSRLSFLIDTGADVSIIPPPKNVKMNKLDNFPLSLFAANQTKIEIYGTKTLSVDFGLRRSFTWQFIVAEINKPVI